MNTYLLLSTKFTGYLLFGYDGKGNLVEYLNGVYKMSDVQHAHMLKELQYCRMKDLFLQWVSANGHQIMQVPKDLSFARFWRDFDNARNRIPAEKLWEKLKASDRAYVLEVNLPAMKRYCAANQWYNQMYPDTYLRGHWQDEWDKIVSKKMEVAKP